ncbi:hypothetical protein [Kribbella sp. DT2]|uniref:hypothetical protein n=1 Tax=Kribbella sp. DT2 TaxID=3393427 RepID=UPI003CF7BE6D
MILTDARTVKPHQTGDQIEADPATAIKYLAPGLDAWLADLKRAAEARSGRS